jgi:uncharacterized protein (DUF488 family)
MLNRQRVLLSLIYDAGREIGLLELYKYAFLFANIHRSNDSSPFYDFVPYHYGPYSFALARELDALERFGYVACDKTSVRFSERLVSEVEESLSRLPATVRWQTSCVVAEYRHLSTTELLRKVYSLYPTYTINSKRVELVPKGATRPPRAEIAIYTLGYERKSIDRFFYSVIQAGVAAIIDVRANPISRKYGFAKSTFSTIASKLGIGYQHVPELGIPSKDRRGLGTLDSYTKLFADYENRIASQPRGAVMRTLRAMESEPSALVCMEEDHNFCHRGRLARTLAEESGLAVVHL